MKIELFDVAQFIDLNHLKEITSPILFQRGSVPDPDGLISNEIFGVDVRSRKGTFAYISLNGHFFHPHIYKTFKRFYRNIERIINGDFYYSIDKDGNIYQDDNGVTGLESIYDNWEKIKWVRSEDPTSMRNERIDLLTKSKKKEVFMEYQIVIPAFYRDIMSDGKGGGETDPLNNMYSKLIRLASLLKSRDMFDFTLHSTYYTMQGLLVEIYDYFKTKLANKNGMIRRFLMGKNIDYCVRSVISTPNFHSERPEEMEIDFRHIGVPISQVCSLCYPFMMKWLKDFFENEFIQPKHTKVVRNSDKLVGLKNPEAIFTDDYIKKMMDQYIRNPESRFKPITVRLEDDSEAEVAFTGKLFDPNDPLELSSISQRPLTVTDILYMAAVDVTKDKHTLITRYPVTDSYGLFLGKTRVVSTIETIPIKVNSTVYRFYPNIDLNTPKNKIATCFKETIQFSNSFLKGICGDYDGDQITAKILWTQEANDEIKRAINHPSYFITPTGANIRVIGNEAIQTLYTLTKDPKKNTKSVPEDVKKEILSLPNEKLTFTYLISLLGKTKDGNKIKEPRFLSTDAITIKPHEYHNKTEIKTTIGKLLFNRLCIEGCGFQDKVGYINYEVNSSGLKKLEKQLADFLIKNEIAADQFAKYIDIRDWLGLQLHAIITTSFTPGTTKIPSEVKKLKNELLKKYDKELKDGDEKTAQLIEKKLIDKTKEVLKDDLGMDLYYSGARGSIDNNLKNIILMRGAVLNPITKKYDIVSSSLMDGMEKSEIPANSNSVVLGAYPKAVGTADSGYLAKQLLAGMQTEVLDEPGSDCGTDKTLEIHLTDENASGYINRNIKVGGKPVLLTTENISSYKGKTIHVYSPMFCTGDKLCSKCVGRYNNKFIGLDASKVATTLTNLNMKKFHDNVVRIKTLDVNDLLLIDKKQGVFGSKGRSVILNDSYCEFYIPMFYFDKNYNFAEDLGDTISTFGIINVGIFNNGKLSYVDTLNIPTWISVNCNESENRVVSIPGEGEIPCKVIKFYQGNEMFNNSIVEDSENSQTYLRFITFGKLPRSIPYSKSPQVWKKNQTLNNVDFGVPPLIQEMILSVAYRYKYNSALKFAKVIGKPNSKVSDFDYEMASIRSICQYSSTFSAITFEDIDSMITASVNRLREKKEESESPIEGLFKL